MESRGGEWVRNQKDSAGMRGQGAGARGKGVAFSAGGSEEEDMVKGLVYGRWMGRRRGFVWGVGRWEFSLGRQAVVALGRSRRKRCACALPVGSGRSGRWELRMRSRCQFSDFL